MTPRQQIPIRTARELYEKLNNWKEVSCELERQTGNIWSADSIRHAAKRPEKPQSALYHPLSPWNEKTHARLMELQANKCSATAMAAILSKETGRNIERGAIIGRLKRFGLSPQSQKPSGGFRRTRYRPKQPKPEISGTEARNGLRAFVAADKAACNIEAPKAPFAGGFNALKNGIKKPPLFPKLSADEKEAITGKGVTIMNLKPHHCRWIITDLPRWGEHLYCGSEKMEGSSYCVFHTRKAWARTAGRKEEAA